MKIIYSVVLVVLAAGLLFFESTPPGVAVRKALEGWPAAASESKPAEALTVIELPMTEGSLRALDAALTLRSVLQYPPKAIVFLTPIAPGEAEALLLSKLEDAKMPVTFTANDNLETLPNVSVPKSLAALPQKAAVRPPNRETGGTREVPAGQVLIVARQGTAAVPSNVWRAVMEAGSLPADQVKGKVPGSITAGAYSAPVTGEGTMAINSLAADELRTIAFDQLMLRTERSEQGSIGADLVGLFSSRLVAVQGAGESYALGLSAVLNGMVEWPVSPFWGWAGLLVVVTLPWWRTGRIHRAMIALGLTSAWLLAALAAYQEFQLPLPLSIMIVLPLLALIPPGHRSYKAEERKLSA